MSLKKQLDGVQKMADKIADRKDDYAEMLDKTAPVLDRVKGIFEKLQKGEKVNVAFELTGFPDVDATLKDAGEVRRIIANAGPGAKEIFDAVLEIARVGVAVAALL